MSTMGPITDSRPRCVAMCKPSKWHPEDGPHRCFFKASLRIDGKDFCRTHANIVGRAGPIWTDVLAFIVKERDANSPLYQVILRAFERSHK